MIRRPPRSTLFPTRRSSDLVDEPLAALERMEMIHGAGEGKFPRERDWSFRHAIVRDAAYAMLTESEDRKSTRLNSSHSQISYAVFCLKKEKIDANMRVHGTT